VCTTARGNPAALSDRQANRPGVKLQPMDPSPHLAPHTPLKPCLLYVPRRPCRLTTRKFRPKRGCCRPCPRRPTRASARAPPDLGARSSVCKKRGAMVPFGVAPGLSGGSPMRDGSLYAASCSRLQACDLAIGAHDGRGFLPPIEPLEETQSVGPQSAQPAPIACPRALHATGQRPKVSNDAKSPAAKRPCACARIIEWICGAASKPRRSSLSR
jgi:hypothetical protein